MTALLIGAPLAASASTISLNESFSASFGAGAPVNPVTGSFSLSFDNAFDATNQTAGLTASINLPTAAIGYTYFKSIDQLLVGGTSNGVDSVNFGTNDFYLVINSVSTNPSFASLVYSQVGQSRFGSTDGSITPAATVPEPSTIALAGIAIAGMAMRRARLRVSRRRA